jgi:tetratricopeptide (TPR) repeat protein
MKTETALPGTLRDGLHHQGTATDRINAEALERDAKAYGLKLLKKGAGARAIVALTQALADAPDDVEALVGLGRAFAQCSRWDEGEPHLRRALELDPNSYAAHFHYGEALLKAGRYQAAEEQFTLALRTRPLLQRLAAKIRSRKEPAPLRHRGTNPDTDDPAMKLEFARARRADVEYARSRIIIGEPNPSWPKSERGRRLHVQNIPLIGPKTRILTIGSCFALEIRHELLRRGFDVWPKYGAVDFDQNTQILNLLPDRDNINHYDTFTIRQEFEQAFGETHFRLEDFWTVSGRNINRVMKRETVWQDPYRKNIYASDPEGVLDISRKLDACIREGIMTADVYVITLGLIETWRNKTNGLHACTYPGVGGGGGEAQTELHVAGFAENYENMRRVCELIFSRFPDRRMILTVSPVALERTFRDLDVVVANMESKTTLRAVAAQICRDFPQVHYLPSYELFVYHDLFHDNGRHAMRDAVETVVDLFAKSFVAPDAAQ